MAPNYGNNPYETELLTTSYVSKLDILLQQRVSKLRGRCEVGTYVGKEASMVQQIGVLDVKQPAARYAPKTPQIPMYTRRWVFPNDRDIDVLVDTFDELRTFVEVKGGIAEVSNAAFERYCDDLIINAANGTAKTGVDSSNFSTESFASTVSTSGGYLVADTFGASASTGLTYPKLVEAFRVMRHNQVDLDAEVPGLIISAQQEADLKKQQEVISKEYNTNMVVENGRVQHLAGFDIIVHERVNTSASNTLRNCLAWVKSGMHLGIWRDRTVSVHPRYDLSSEPWEMYATFTAGATRTQLFKVVQINAADTSGFDPTAP
jgi:hypothetical protein